MPNGINKSFLKTKKQEDNYYENKAIILFISIIDVIGCIVCAKLRRGRFILSTERKETNHRKEKTRKNGCSHSTAAKYRHKNYCNGNCKKRIARHRCL